MKRFAFSTVIFFGIFYCNSQSQDEGRGFSLYGSTNDFLVIDLFSYGNNNRISFGYSHQFNGQKIKVKKKQNESDGKTEIDKGDYIWLIDLGYGRIFYERLTIGSQISIGGKKYFTTFEDEKYSDDGYSLITNSKAVMGMGLQIGFLMRSGLEPFVGMHTLRKMDLGLRLSW